MVEKWNVIISGFEKSPCFCVEVVKENMNVLFLTLVGFETLQIRSLYTDLLREFVKNGHSVYVISPIEKRENKPTHLNHEKNATILRLQIGDITKTSFIKKGISTVMIDSSYKKGIKQFFSDVKFDLVLYSTPPITLVSAVEYVKKRDNAKTYLLLKDIFPQNAVDIGIMTKSGIKGILYKHFRNKEKRLYRVSDRIGCMSPANVEYVIKHNPEVDSGIVEVCPNSCSVTDLSVDNETKSKIRGKYGIPLDKKVFIYGGNLGKPQGIPFLVECLKKCDGMGDILFLIVGSGTEYHLISEYVEKEKPGHVKLMQYLPLEEYDNMVGSCDVGLVFLDHRFTIPNFPSRLLAYMLAKLPVLAVTDPNTDIGKIIVEGGFGWWCESNDADKFQKVVKDIMSTEIKEKGICGFEYLKQEYSVERSYKTIIEIF